MLFKDHHRLIITDKGLEISKDLRSEISLNTYSLEDSLKPHSNKHILSENLPGGYYAQCQAKRDI